MLDLLVVNAFVARTFTSFASWEVLTSTVPAASALLSVHREDNAFNE